MSVNSVKYYITLLISFCNLYVGYSQDIKQQILDHAFLKQKYSNSDIIDITKFSTVRDFNKQFWQKDTVIKDFQFVIPYNFDTYTFKQDSKYGLPVTGFPYLCRVFDCSERWLKLELKSRKRYELWFAQGGLEENIEKNIFNYGELPYFSRQPESAYVEILLSQKIPLSKIDVILSKIVQAYINIIDRKAKESQKSVEEMVTLYPLKIMLTELKPPPKIKKTKIKEVPDDIDIKEEIDIK